MRGSGAAPIDRVYTSEEAFSGDFMSMAPDLTLAMADGGLVSILPSQRIVSPRAELAGAHRPVGVFLARGPGMRRGAQVGELSILDVAPTLLYGLDLPIPEDFEGRVPDEVFESRQLEQRPVRIGRRAAIAAPSLQPVAPAAQTFGEEEAALVMKRLRDLGYVE